MSRDSPVPSRRPRDGGPVRRSETPHSPPCRRSRSRDATGAVMNSRRSSGTHSLSALVSSALVTWSSSASSCVRKKISDATVSMSSSFASCHSCTLLLEPRPRVRACCCERARAAVLPTQRIRASLALAERKRCPRCLVFQANQARFESLEVSLLARALLFEAAARPPSRERRKRFLRSGFASAQGRLRQRHAGLTRLTRRAVSRVRVAAPQRGLSSAKRPAAQGIGARGPVTWGTLIATSAAGGALLLYYESEKERRQTQVSKRVKSVGKPALGGPWTLVDTAGQAVTDAQLRAASSFCCTLGSPAVLTFARANS